MDVRRFFDLFVKDFTAFNGELIASRYPVPYTAIDRQGQARSFLSFEEIAEYFQSYLDEYKRQGIRSCDYSDLSVIELNSHCVCAAVTWHMLTDSGDETSCWRESYHLLLDNGNIEVFASVDQ